MSGVGHVKTLKCDKRAEYGLPRRPVTEILERHRYLYVGLPGVWISGAMLRVPRFDINGLGKEVAGFTN